MTKMNTYLKKISRGSNYQKFYIYSPPKVNIISGFRPSGSPVTAEEENLEQLCPTRVELAKPRRLLNTEQNWRVIVNIPPKFQQSVRLETCLQVCSLIIISRK